MRGRNGDATAVDQGLKMPERFPAAPGFGALPDPAPRRACPDIIGLRGIARETSDPSANICWPDAFPLRRSRRRHEFFLRPRAFRDEPADARLAQRPRCSRLEPDASPFVIPRNAPEFPSQLALSWPRREWPVYACPRLLPLVLRSRLLRSFSHP